MPRAIIRIPIRVDHLDDHGYLTFDALREVRGKLATVPAEAPVHVDLGPLRLADAALMHELAALPCAPRLVIESPDWHVAEDAVLALQGLLSEAVT